jgi:exosortase A
MATAIVSRDRLVLSQWVATGLIVLLAILCDLALFWPTVRSMVDIWAQSRTFAHCFLVLPAAGYLIWSYRDKVASQIPSPSVWGAVALILSGGGWVLGYRLDLVWLQQASVVASLPGLVWAILGGTIFRLLAWPLGFLFFLLPVGTSIEPWLQDLTARFVLVGLQFTGIPYFYDNYLIRIPSGIWEVAPDCGGLRYLLPGLALGYAFATLAYWHPSRRLVFLIVCAAVLMVANGIRAYGIIVGDHFGIAEGTDHRVFSYTVYGITIFSLFWLGPKRAGNITCPLVLDDSPREGRGHDICRTLLMATISIALLAIAPALAWLWVTRS